MARAPRTGKVPHAHGRKSLEHEQSAGLDGKYSLTRKHPNSGDLYTPITPEILELFAQLKRRYETWRRVAYHVDTRLKVLRNIRNGQRKAISMRLLDRIITHSGVGSLEDYTWFTPDDLVALGIWKSFYPEDEE
jgi:hypothetical protein